MSQKSVNRLLIRLMGLILAGIFIVLSLRYLHVEKLFNAMQEFFVGNPFMIVAVTISYLLSFILRAEAWRLYLGKKVRFYSCLQGVLLSLFVNHITPIKVGDAVRIGVLSWREKNISPEISAHSVIVLRAIDMFFLLMFSFIGLVAFSRPFVFRYSLGLLFILVIMILIGSFFIKKHRPRFVEKHIQIVKTSLAGKNFVLIMLFIAFSWALEGAVVWSVTASIGNGLPIYKAIWVNSITVGGQIFQITPGGISTYESVMTAALASFHYPIKDGYMVALISHSYKFIFSYLVGCLLLIHSPVTKIRQIREILLRRGRPE